MMVSRNKELLRKFVTVWWVIISRSMIISRGPSRDLVNTNIALTLLERCEQGSVISFMTLPMHCGDMYKEYN